MIAALLLAAGSARRFGAPKLLQDLHGRPLVRWAADALVASKADLLFAVVPPLHDELRAALAPTGAQLILNARADDGLGTSIACGVRALPQAADAVLLALADEPLLPTAVVDAVIRGYRDSPEAAIVAPYYGHGARAAPGHPVLFDRSVFAELVALDGDSGARVVVQRDPKRVTRVDIAGDPPADVDTTADLARLRGNGQYMSRTSSPIPPRT